jgi:hypothetical protein
MLSAVGMFELAATPQRRFKGLTLLVDRDGMEIDVRQSFSVSIPGMIGRKKARPFGWALIQ